MELLLKIFVGNIVLLFVRISVHECGHWVFGRLAGLPGRGMRIWLLTFPLQVQLRDEQKDDGWASVSDFDRHWSILAQSVPSTRGKFLYVVGGFVFETVLLAALGRVVGVGVGRPLTCREAQERSRLVMGT